MKNIKITTYTSIHIDRMRGEMTYGFKVVRFSLILMFIPCFISSRAARCVWVALRCDLNVLMKRKRDVQHIWRKITFHLFFFFFFFFPFSSTSLIHPQQCRRRRRMLWWCDVRGRTRRGRRKRAARFMYVNMSQILMQS